MYRGRDAIRTVGTGSLKVTGNTIGEGWSIGINKNTTMPNEYTEVWRNNMYGCRDNIFATTFPGIGLIYENELGADGYNVRLLGLGKGVHNWNVKNNDGLIVAGTAGPKRVNVYFNNVTGGTVQDNINTVSSRYNFDIRGGENNSVLDNLTFANDEAMQMWGSPNSLISCNDMEVPVGLHMFNNSTGTDILTNDLSSPGIDADFNLVYGTPFNTLATVGLQDRTGNLFDLSTTGNEVAINHTPIPLLALINRFIVTDPAIQGDELYPFFAASSNQWFEKLPGGQNEECELLGGEVQTDRATALEKAARVNLDLLDLGVDSLYGAEVTFDTELKMFRQLYELQTLTALPVDLQSVYNSYSGTDIEKFIQFESIYENAVSMTDAETAQYLSLVTDIENLYQAARVIQWFTVDSLGNFSIDSLAKANLDATMAQAAQKMTDLAAMRATKQQALDNELGNLATVNNSVSSPATVSGQNLKTINGLMIQRMNSSFSGFSAVDSSTISGIALQCVGQGGEAVYTARSLLAEINRGEEPAYADECVQSLATPSPPALFRHSGSAKLSPNPASTYVELRLPTGHEASQVNIVDGFGRQLKTIDLEDGQVKVGIDVSQLPSGIYFLSDKNGSFAPLRFVVSK